MRKMIGATLLLMGTVAAHAQIPCLSTIGSGSLATGVTAFYPFSSGSTNDFSGWGHHMINSGAIPTADRFGAPNCAYYFEEDLVCASNDYMHTSAAFLDHIFDPGQTFSVSLWYRPVTPVVPYGFSDYELLLGRGFPGVCAPVHCPDTWEQWSIGLYDCRQVVAGDYNWSNWQTAVGGSGLGCAGYYASTSSTGPYSNGWHHVAYVYNGGLGAQLLFVDGIAYPVLGSGCIPPLSPAAVGELVLGDMFTGDLDDIVIYDRDLSVSEVFDLYHAPGCCDKNQPPPKDTCIVLDSTLSSGLMAFYPFHMGSLADESGNGHDLNNPTTATTTLDRHGNQQCAYGFDRSSGEYLEILPGGSSFLDGITSGDFSVSLWYQPRGPRALIDYELLIGRGSTSSTVACSDIWGDWSIGLTDCRKAAAGFDAYSTWQTTAMSCSSFLTGITGSWHHLVLTYNAAGGTRDLWIDGTLYSTVTGPCGPMTADVGELMLGVDYTGDLDEIAIYNRTLSASEVQLLGLVKDSCCYARRPAIPKTPSQDGVKPMGVKIYPNPAGNSVSVTSFGSPIKTISVYTATGQLYGTYTFNSSAASIDIEKLPVGMYSMRVTTENATTTEKLIKQ